MATLQKSQKMAMLNIEEGGFNVTLGNIQRVIKVRFFTLWYL